ncbi:hypothetical protein [Pelodictyon phaeoclathratiforme]|jgi:hypothetical protein|uniref:hypothetical protein n=1 Tax=Pelodictyon phaeoclathratiforme TaxID=34090 RepID=UPI00167F732A|nr:hypothetical protein [Pelodictyon phaeoclathratiforme]
MQTLLHNLSFLKHKNPVVLLHCLKAVGNGISVFPELMAFRVWVTSLSVTQSRLAVASSRIMIGACCSRILGRCLSLPLSIMPCWLHQKKEG